jgi:hypothetical protein
VYGAAFEAAKAIATYYSRLADTDIESMSVKYSQKHKQYLKVANRLQIKAESSGSGLAKPDVNGVSVSEMETVWQDTDRPDDRFYRGQFDNPPNFHDENDYDPYY